MKAMKKPEPLIQVCKLLEGIAPVPSALNTEISGLSIDSRKIKAGDLFLACAGSSTDARQFIPQVIAAGASFVLAEAGGEYVEVKEILGAPVVPVSNLDARIGQIAARFYDYPAKNLWLTGCTGTNGKTSVCQFIASYYRQLGVMCGISGTLGNGLAGNKLAAASAGPGTTPDALSIQKIFFDVVQAGAEVMAMEVSSHGLDQRRVDVDDFDVAVFTNLSHDHLDYHGDMQSYGEAKLRLFAGQMLKVAVVNIDDPFAANIVSALSVNTRLLTYSLKNPAADVYAENIKHTASGLQIRLKSPWGEGQLNTSLLGSFNASNLLAALTSVLVREASEPGFKFSEFLTVASSIQPVSGRMEVVTSERPTVIVDYAHTPDGLRTALSAIREHFSGSVYCVFGCGGDRDKDKRPVMASVAEELADVVVVTDDNPRNENSEEIIADIMKGFRNSSAVIVQSDRALAIEQVIAAASEHDVVLVAGKGHEEYQDVSGQRLAFSDVKQARISLQHRRESTGGDQ